MQNNEAANFDVTYHRNGVSGWGFHTVTFDWQDGDVLRHMMATVPNTTDTLEDAGRTAESQAKLTRDDCVVCVVELANPKRTLRGDYFAGAIWQALNAQHKKDFGAPMYADLEDK